MVKFRSFCKSTQLHGFYEFSHAHSKLGKIIWLIAIVVSLSVTTYLVADAANEFMNEPVRVVIEKVKHEDMFYPPMKFCFFHWLQWVNWTKVERLNFTKYELLYAMSYLTDVHSSKIFDVQLMENSFKDKLKKLNMTLKQFYLTIAQRKKVLFEHSNNNYTIEFTTINKMDMKNIFHLHHTICYVFPENVMTDVINEVKLSSSNDSMEEGYTIKIDLNLLFRYNSSEYLTQEETKKIEGYVLEKFGANPRYAFLPVMYFPNIYSPGKIPVLCGYSATAIKTQLSVYSKKNLLWGQTCKENMKSIAMNFTFLENSFENARKQIFEENHAFESWIGYPNDIRQKKIFFIDAKGDEIEHLTYKRRHKLNSWFESPGKVKKGHDLMVELQNAADQTEIGCEFWDFTFEEATTGDGSGIFLPVTYPKADQIVMRKEVDEQTWSNFVGNVGGLLGIWTGASIVTIVQIVHLCFNCSKED